MKQCTKCGIEKSLDQFSKHAKAPDGLQWWCKQCKRAHDNNLYKTSPTRKSYITANRKAAKLNTSQWVYEYLLTHPCVDCGETDPVVLDFDHIDRSLKRTEVSKLVGCSLKSVQDEVAKCEVRCANCHRRRTAVQFDWYKHILLQ